MTQAKRLINGLMVCALLAAGPRGAHAEAPADAGGIRTDFGDVLIENLGIGRTYNLRDLAGVPLKVTNTGLDTVNIVIDVHIPSDDMILQTRREMGVKPIPAVDWITLSQSQFVVPSQESAYTDIIIKIPDDPALYGKKFQASIYSRTADKRFLNLGVWSHLLLNVAPSAEAQAKIEQNRKKGFIGNMDYTLLPDKLVLTGVPIGKRYNVTKENKKTIKIANSGSERIELRTKIVRVGETPLSLQVGYEEAPDLKWLGVTSSTVKVEPDSFVDPGLVLNLPNDSSLHQKKFMFILKVEPADPEVVGVTFYGKIYVEVE